MYAPLLATLVLGPVTSAPQSGSSWWQGSLSARGDALPIRLEIRDTTGGRRVYLDVPTMLMATEPLSTVDSSGYRRAEFPFGLGTFDLTPREGVISATGLLGRDTMTLQLRPGAPPPYRREEVRIANGPVTLAGTLVLPDGRGPFPAVVLVHGSGNVDRAQWEYRSQTDFLARLGWAVLVYDKRGTGGSSGRWWEADTNFADLAADALAAVRFLSQRREIRVSTIGLMGASQAGWVMARAATQIDRVAFVVFISSPAVSPAEQELQSVEYRMRGDSMSEPDITAARAHTRLFMYVAQTGRGWALLRESVAAARQAPWARYVFLPDSSPHARWMGRHSSFDPVPYFQRIRVPVLALYGAEDVVVPPAENVLRFERSLRSGTDVPVRVCVLPDADHRLEVHSGRDASGRWHWFQVAPQYFQILPAWLDQVR